MKNIMSLMVSQKKTRPKPVKENITDSAQIQLRLTFTPYIKFGLTFNERHQSKHTRSLIMSAEDEQANKKYWFDDRDYISWKLIHEKREYLTPEQNRKLVNDTLKLLIPQKKVNNFKKSGLTVKELSDQFMVHTEIVYMRLNLTEY